MGLQHDRHSGKVSVSSPCTLSFCLRGAPRDRRTSLAPSISAYRGRCMPPAMVLWIPNATDRVGELSNMPVLCTRRNVMSKKWVCLISAFLVLGPVWAVQAAVTPVGWWKFDEKTGTTAVDSSVNKNPGTLYGGAAWVAGQIDGAVQFSGADGCYVNLPIGSLISKLTSTTFAIWANCSGLGGNWQRIFDFGTGENVYMFLTPSQGGSNTGNMRFAITIGSNGAESQLNAPNRLATGWHHIAVAINGDTKAMQLYLDGVVVASGTTAVLPNAMGNTNQNWLGRSQWPDAYYQGSLDDFRHLRSPARPGRNSEGDDGRRVWNGR